MEMPFGQKFIQAQRTAVVDDFNGLEKIPFLGQSTELFDGAAGEFMQYDLDLNYDCFLNKENSK